MVAAINISIDTAGGKYKDIIEAADHLARGDYGSVGNAVAVMIRQSELFKQAMAEIAKAEGAT